ncbi:hypothetical protein BC937DRAFT_94136 [Endogone sp. FLAS-F59071]|nr:hypothetical protein BC937DRAFT_94136 [Endogone sp. FLAS-F59071]|eukprot:RUS14240.1 hypothetical protein BC937DRAFT_94136 [Endogone sp. FLAS-F59071]
MGIFSQKIPATSITTNIERATAPDQQGEDWDLIIQICNSVNSSELGAKEARKLLQKKLVSAESVNTKVLALSVSHLAGDDGRRAQNEQSRDKDVGLRAGTEME